MKKRLTKHQKDKDLSKISEIAFVIFLFITSLIPRLLYLKGINFSSDDMFYCKAASFIIAGGFSQLLNAGEDYLWTFSIGWPLILGYLCRIFKLELNDVYSMSPCIINAFFSSIAVIITYLFAKAFWKDRLAGGITALLFMYSPLIFRVGTDALAHNTGLFFFILTLYFGFCLVNKPLWYNYLGFYISLGLALLVRYPNYIIPILFLSWILISHRKRFAQLILRWENLVFLIFPVIAIIPQLLYNKVYHKGYFNIGYLYYRHFEQVALREQSLLFRFDTFLSYFTKWSFISPFIFPFILLGIYRLLKDKEISRLTFLSLWFFIFFISYSLTIPHWDAAGIFTWFPGYTFLILTGGGISSLKTIGNKKLSSAIVLITTTIIFLSSAILSFYVNRFYIFLGKVDGEMPFANLFMEKFFSLSLKDFSIYKAPSFPDIFSFYIFSQKLIPLYLIILFLFLLFKRKEPNKISQKISFPIWLLSIPIAIALMFSLIIRDFGTRTRIKYEKSIEEIDMLYNKGKWKDCLSKIDNTFSLFGEGKNLLEKRGDCLYNLGMIEDAISEWKRSTNYSVLYKAGVLLFSKGRYKEAIETVSSFTSEIKKEKEEYYVPRSLDPQFVSYCEKAIFLQGESFERLKDYEKAKECFRFLSEKAKDPSLQSNAKEKLKIIDKYTKIR